MGPVPGEEKTLEPSTVLGQSAQQRISELKKELEDGRITKREYDLQVDAVISTL